MTTSGTTRTRCGNLRIKYVVRLSAEERQELEEVLRKGKAAAQRRRHAQILLKVDEGPLGPAWTNDRTAEAVGVSAQTVINVRRRLVERGFAAALGRKKQARPFRAIVLDGEKEARLIALACGKPPAGHARWTLRLLADRLVELQVVESVSLETVRKALKKTNCSPTAARIGASRRRPTPSSSAPWRTSWRTTSCRTAPTSRSPASTSVRCS
jgi:transposase